MVVKIKGWASAIDPIDQGNRLNVRGAPNKVTKQGHPEPMQPDPLPTSRRRCRELPLVGAYWSGVGSRPSAAFPVTLCATADWTKLADKSAQKRRKNTANRAIARMKNNVSNTFGGG
jgi:hypothetical protein